MALIKNKNFWLIIALIAIIMILIVANSDYSYIILASLCLALLLVFFWFYPQIGLYAVIILYPFNFWEFVYSDINVSWCDMVALALFISWLAKTLYLHYSGKQEISLKNFPGWFFMLLFTIASALSLMDVGRDNFWLSVKFLVRPIIFFYLMFIVLPVNIFDNFKKLFTALKVSFGLGLGLAFIGIWSILFPPFPGILRAMPVAILGIWPLGTNQNALAECFVVLIPIGLILFWYEKDVLMKNIYLLGTLIMVGVNLLTLSRAAWLAMVTELFLLLVWRYKDSAKRLFTNYVFYIILLLLGPIVYLMYDLATSNVMVSSNISRFKLIEISLNMFKQYPLFGAGIGTFVSYVSQTSWFILEYGVAFDAHGFIFKTLAESGIFGMASFILILIYILYVMFLGYQRYNKTSYALLLLGMVLVVVGGIVFQLFSTDYYMARFWLPMGLALASLSLVNKNFNINKKI